MHTTCLIVGCDIIKEPYKVTFPADTSGAEVYMPTTINIIDDDTSETSERFFLFITNYTSLNHSDSNSTNASDYIQYTNRVAHVVIYDHDFPGMIVWCNSSDIGSQE